MSILCLRIESNFQMKFNNKSLHRPQFLHIRWTFVNKKLKINIFMLYLNNHNIDNHYPNHCSYLFKNHVLNSKINIIIIYDNCDDFLFAAKCGAHSSAKIQLQCSPQWHRHRVSSIPFVHHSSLFEEKNSFWVQFFIFSHSHSTWDLLFLFPIVVWVLQQRFRRNS